MVLFAAVSAALGGVLRREVACERQERPHGAGGGALGSGRAARRARES